LWKKCPSRHFYAQLITVFEKIRQSLSGPAPPDFATCPYERSLLLFSQPHLEYVLIREFQRTRIGAGGDLPIVWATTLWRQNRHARKACCIEFDPLLLVNAHSDVAHRTPQIQIPPQATDQVNLTIDHFWPVISSSNPTLCFANLLGLRIFLHMISAAHKDRTGLSLNSKSLSDFVMGLELTPGVSAKIFWDNPRKINDFFKNRLFKNDKRSLDEPTATPLGGIKVRWAQDRKLAKVWDVVFKHVDYDQMERIYVLAVNKQVDLALPEFSILEEPETEIGVEIDSRLPNSDTAMAPVLQYASEKGTVTVKLIQRLARLRIEWQTNRVAFGTALQEGHIPEAAFVSNLVLAKAHEFSDKRTRMSLSNAGTEELKRIHPAVQVTPP
jgi:hypothetical protein